VNHYLKIWPEPFAAILDGRKRFEVRKDDRGYKVGDVLHLREWDPHYREHTGRVQVRTVRYIARGWGLPDDICVMGLDDGPAEPSP
jgi:hypothetical protein